MPLSALPVASAHITTWEFIRNLFTGAFHGDLLSIVVLAIVALIVLRLIAARWVFVLAKQTMIFGGLAFVVWYGAYGEGAIADRWGDTAANAFAVVGGLVVATLFFIMLYIFFLRRGREKAAIKAGMSPEQARQIAYGKGAKALEGKKPTTMRMGAGALAGQGLPVHYQKGKAAPTGGGGSSAGGSSSQAAMADPETSRLEETLKKMNVLGATKEQNLMTVSVLILVAQFGVFTSRTVSAPNATIGMTLFAIFVVAATVFVMTAYKDKMKGVVHFVYATIFALILAGVLLVYWQQTFLCADYPNAQAISSACTAATTEVPVTWSIALNPRFFFASDGLIAAITGVAFSTLLTKGGG
jgi:hypothetical protein